MRYEIIKKWGRRHVEKIVMVSAALILSAVFVWSGRISFFDNNYQQPTNDNRPVFGQTIPAPAVIKRLPVSPPAPLSRLSFKAMVVKSESGGDTLAVKFGDEALPLASLTKLMTALVLLGNEIDWNSEVIFAAEDVRGGATPHLKVGDVLTKKDLWQVMLVGSDNDAAAALVRSAGLTDSEMAAAMNKKAKELGLSTTYFEEPTGLSPLNVSTPNEFAVIAKQALVNPRIAEPLAQNSVTVTVNNKSRIIKSTDQDLKQYQDAAKDGWRFITGKTGYIEASGYNAAIIAEDSSGTRYVTVVFGAPTLKLRVSSAARLLDFVISGLQKMVR